MVGENSVIFNMDQVKDIFERHLKDELLKDADFIATEVSYDYQKQNFTVKLGPKTKADVTEPSA